MTTFEIWLLGIALAIDCFSVSVANGFAAGRWIARPMILMGISFGIFQGGMTWLGYLGASLFSEEIGALDHWIAFGLLSFLGGRMIYDSFFVKKEETASPSRQFSYPSILMMSIATSIDALAVGVSLAFLQNGSWLVMFQPVYIIACCSTILTFVGLSLGINLGKRLEWHADAIGGCVLIIIGIKVLIEHLS